MIERRELGISVSAEPIKVKQEREEVMVSSGPYSDLHERNVKARIEMFRDLVQCGLTIPAAARVLNIAVDQFRSKAGQ